MIASDLNLTHSVLSARELSSVMSCFCPDAMRQVEIFWTIIGKSLRCLKRISGFFFKKKKDLKIDAKLN